MTDRAKHAATRGLVLLISAGLAYVACAIDSPILAVVNAVLLPYIYGSLLRQQEQARVR